MRPVDRIRAIEEFSCVLVRHGGKHDWYRNPTTGISQPVPRHREIKAGLARHIIKMLSNPADGRSTSTSTEGSLPEPPSHVGLRQSIPDGGKALMDEIKPLDVVILTTDMPPHNLHRGEIGAVVECYTDGTYDVEFVAQDGYTYALVPLQADQLIPLRQKPTHDAPDVVPAMA